MKKQILLAALSILYIQGYSQTEKKRLNTIGISLPVIWNNSEAVYYILGNLKTPNGKSKSNGLNINYSRVVYKNFFLTTGVGLFRQRFNIARPFTFDTPIQFGFFTQKYCYDNIKISGGIGYKQTLGIRVHAHNTQKRPIIRTVYRFKVLQQLKLLLASNLFALELASSSLNLSLSGIAPSNTSLGE